MRVTVLSHNLSSNSAMRAYRLAIAARTFAEVGLIGPAEKSGPWEVIPSEPWIRTVRERRFPKFAKSFLELVEAADGDVLIAVKPHLASFGAALVAAERRGTPVVLDLDDLDVALAPRSEWAANPEMADVSRPASAVYVSLLTRASGAASAVTVASTALQRRFGGTLVPHGCATELFDPAAVDRDEARASFGFDGPTVLFPGTPREHKGLSSLAEAVSRIPGARLAVPCRDKDLTEPDWESFPLLRIGLVPYPSLPRLLAAADVVAIPQSDSEAASHQMPMKVYDAMAMGRPIVATAVSDLPATLDGCARLVPPGDVDRLTAAIAGLLDDPGEARSLGERARARALESYSIGRVAEKLREVLAGVAPAALQNPRPRARGEGAASSAVVLDPLGVSKDPGMPYLARAIDPEDVSRRLACVLESPELRLLAVRVVRHKPGRRCLIEYEVERDRPGGGRERMTIVGKSRARGSPESSDRLLRALWTRGFAAGGEDRVSVPEPLGVLSEYRMSLQRKAPGVPATVAFEAGGPALALRIAEAICKLHRAGVAPRRSHRVGDELAILRERLGRVAAASPQWKPRLERIALECERLASNLPAPSPRGIHRDFYADQVIVDGPRVCLVDFDLYCEGDPALDAGNFVGHLIEESLRRSGRADAREDCERAFEERFLELSPEVARRSVRAYATLTLARHVELSTRFPERRPFTETLIELCEERLGAGSRTGAEVAVS